MNTQRIRKLYRQGLELRVEQGMRLKKTTHGKAKANLRNDFLLPAQIKGNFEAIAKPEGLSDAEIDQFSQFMLQDLMDTFIGPETCLSPE